mgnify:CR=1 FL=1
MATGKRFYWIKLKDSFMNSEVVDFLMSQPNGANYVVLYQMLCLKTINKGFSPPYGDCTLNISQNTAKLKSRMARKYSLYYNDVLLR